MNSRRLRVSLRVLGFAVWQWAGLNAWALDQGWAVLPPGRPSNLALLQFPSFTFLFCWTAVALFVCWRIFYLPVSTERRQLLLDLKNSRGDTEDARAKFSASETRLAETTRQSSTWKKRAEQNESKLQEALAVIAGGAAEKSTYEKLDEAREQALRERAETAQHCANLEAEGENLRKKIAALQDQVKRVEFELAGVQVKCVNLDKHLQSELAEKSALQKELAEQKKIGLQVGDRAARLQAECQELQSQREALQKTREELQTQLAAARKEQATMELALRDENAAQSVVKSQLDQLSHEKMALEKELAKELSRTAELNEALNQHEAELSHAREGLQVAAQQAEHLHSELESRTQEYQALDLHRQATEAALSAQQEYASRLGEEWQSLDALHRQALEENASQKALIGQLLENQLPTGALPDFFATEDFAARRRTLILAAESAQTGGPARRVLAGLVMLETDLATGVDDLPGLANFRKLYQTVERDLRTWQSTLHLQGGAAERESEIWLRELRRYVEERTPLGATREPADRASLSPAPPVRVKVLYDHVERVAEKLSQKTSSEPRNAKKNGKNSAV